MSSYTDEEAREATEVAAQLRELANSPGWQYLVDFVESFSIANQKRLLNTELESLKDISVILRLSGWINGAQFVLDSPRKAAERAANMAVETEVPA